GREGDGLEGDASGDPRTGAELFSEADVVEDGGDMNDDAEGDEGDSGVDGEAGVVGRGMLGGLELAEEEAEAGEGESDAHEAEAGADPGEEGAFGGEIDARVVDRAGHRLLDADR